MAHHILALEALTDHPRNFYVNIGIVQGGTHENMVPAECRAICYALVPTAQEEAELRDAIHALQQHDPDVRTEVTPGLGRPPFVKTPAIQALYDHAAALALEAGLPSAGERVAGGGSDGNFTAAMGIPTLDGLGCTGAGAHAPFEHILWRDLGPRCATRCELLATIE